MLKESEWRTHPADSFLSMSRSFFSFSTSRLVQIVLFSIEAKAAGVKSFSLSLSFGGLLAACLAWEPDDIVEAGAGEVERPKLEEEVAYSFRIHGAEPRLRISSVIERPAAAPSELGGWGS